MKKIVLAALSSMTLIAGCSKPEGSADTKKSEQKEVVKEEIKLEDWYTELDRDGAIALLQHGTGVVFLVDQNEEELLKYYGDILHDMNMTASVYYINDENRSDVDIIWLLSTFGIMDETIYTPQILFVSDGEKIGDIRDEKNLTGFLMYAEQVQMKKSENSKDACDTDQACTYGAE